VVVVVLRVRLGGFRSVVVRVVVMSGGQMRLMACLLVIASLVVLRGLAMMPSGVLVMFGGFVMMLGGGFRHGCPPMEP
jgi:hypothetical protein